MEEDNDGKHRNHVRVRRCIDATRCVVIVLLVVVVVAVTGLAIAAMYLHVEKIEISVASGYVSVPGLPPVSTSSPRPRPPPEELVLFLVLRFSNPNDRGFAFDNINISIYFHDDGSNDNKVRPFSKNSSLQLVPANGTLDLSVSLTLRGDESAIATLIGKVNAMKKSTLCLNGTFQTLYTDDLIHAPPRPAVYECPNVTVGTLPLLKMQAKGGTDVHCQDLSPRKWK